ncbi:MAG: VWA domain-containing protein [Deltaproteobacteria bacterium]|nr:VWA domain-containing protein [Deltaproteobacteria bacterium]
MRRLALSFCCLAVACSDVRLEPPEEDVVVPRVDNEVALRGSFCTSPAGNVEYPVKVLFVVDGSGSQQFSDQNRQRVVAVEETINSLIGLGNTYFKVVVFNASVTATPPVSTGCDVFTRQLTGANSLMEALNNLAQADTLTDYQGALSVAYNELNRDMGCIRVDPQRGLAELGRTKYVVIFISDGMPDPQCTIGIGNDLDPVTGGPYRMCESSNYVNCLLKRPGTVCDRGRYGTCANGAAGCAFNDPANTDQANHCCDQQGGEATLFGGTAASELEGGNDYNQPYQILQKISDIMELQDRYQLGELRVHSGLVMDPLADPAVIGIFGDSSQAAPLMKQVAELGLGQYMEFYGGDQIDFLQINFEAIKQQRVIRGFFADNRAARLRNGGLEPDTDLDGLTDEEEFGLGTDPTQPDTDADGYSDLIETRQTGFSFDPKDACYPPIDDTAAGDGLATRTGVCVEADVVNGAVPACRGRRGPVDRCGAGDCDELGFLDTDRDGLHDCEELAIGTDPTQPDTDRDGIPDLQEVTFGLDPSRWDADDDADNDGLPNAVEIEWHLNPTVRQTDEETRSRYRYSRPETGNMVDGRSCYDFQVRRMQLAYTLDTRIPGFQDGVGFNEVRLYILENMADNLSGSPLVRAACVRAQYIPPSLKVPSSGEIVIDEGRFKYLGNLEAQFNTPALLFAPQADCVMAE